MYEHMYICMHVCMYACMYLCIGTFAHGTIGRRVDPSSQCSTTGVTKAVVCVILPVG